jgi:amidase
MEEDAMPSPSPDATADRSGSSEELAFAAAVEQARMLRDGEVSSRQLVETYLERIERFDGQLNAFRCVRAESAREEADAADARLRDSERAPLLGLPIAVKDNLDVAGELTTHGTGIVIEPAAADCEVVRRLREAGAVIVGKTNLNELALWGHFTSSRAWGETRNPWDPRRGPAGSSGGSAVAVAAGLASAAIGTDGGGSIRLPAAACGIVGLKPQRGRISLAPLSEHWHGLTHVGPLTRSVEDAALLLDALAGAVEGDADRPPALESLIETSRLRIAVSLRPGMPGKPGPEARTALEEIAELARELGHAVIEGDPEYGELRTAFSPRWLHGAHQDAVRLGGRRGLEPRTRTMTRIGSRLGKAALRARAKEGEIAARIKRLFDDCDILLTPVAPAPPAPLGDGVHRGGLRTFFGGVGRVCYTPAWNITGQPAIAIPAGFDDRGLPRAVQVIGRPNDEPSVLSLAAQIEAARPWARRRPPLG